MSAGEPVKVAIIENAVEAGLVEAVLSERAIPHIIRSYRDSAYDGIYQLQQGWGAIYAPADYKAQILEILSDIRAGVSFEKEFSDTDFSGNLEGED